MSYYRYSAVDNDRIYRWCRNGRPCSTRETLDFLSDVGCVYDTDERYDDDDDDNDDDRLVSADRNRRFGLVVRREQRQSLLSGNGGFPSDPICSDVGGR